MKAKDTSNLLSDLAYKRILEALMDRSVPLGAMMTQTELTKLTAMPVGPVRDALKALENDGIVVVHPRSGIEVIRRSTDLIRATYQFRLLIEREGIRAFALQAPLAQVRDMIELHRTTDADYAAADPNIGVADQMVAIEDAFHRVIVASLGNQMIDVSYRRLSLMSRIIKLNEHVLPGVARTSVGEHLVVLQAVMARDPDAAEAAMRDHLTRAMTRNLGLS